MKKIFLTSTCCTLLLALVMWSCKKSDSMDPELGTFVMDSYDVIQLTNDNPDVPVQVSYSDDRGIDSVEILIYPMGGTTPVARNVVRNFIHSSTGRTLIKTPFPYPDAGGPNGVYTIEYRVTDRSGKTTTKSYNVNILNNKVANLCTFPSDPLPAGKNVWIRVTSTQPLDPTDDVYITGAFEVANGASGDWSGGNPMFKLTRVAGSNQCFYIALNLSAGHEFKFTLGDWGREFLGNAGQVPGNVKWNDKSAQNITIYNWRGKPVVMQTIPQVLPNQGIVSGNMSVIADVNSTSDLVKYYLVQKGGNINDKSHPMYRVMNDADPTTKVMGSVPKNSAVEYIVVRDNNGTVAKGVNAWGFETSVKWDGMTNPVSMSVPYFEGDAGILTVPANLYIVGDATPGDWNNPVPTPSQQFTLVSPGRFELASIALAANKGYLFLPVNGDWSRKYGGDNKLNGPIVPEGNNIPSPDVAGNYKIVVDFTTGQYTLTKL